MQDDVLPRSLEYLAGPPEAVGRAPVSTAPQLLDLGSLSPKDFERLCFRVARQGATVQAARMYGIHGQAQQGIDLFTYRADGTYAAIQCKRSSDEFAPGEITKAVDDFLAGEWADKSEEFVLAVSANLERIQTAGQVEVERTRLAGHGIRFVVWDQTELSAVLKDQPRLVDDFFGRETVRVFNGDLAADGLGERLDAGDAIAYRARLRELYREVFWALERGAHSDDRYVPLDERFVLPDVVVAEDRSGPALSEPVQPSLDRPEDSEPFDYRNVPAVSAVLRGRAGPAPTVVSGSSDRIGVADWLAAGQWHLVVGSPGAGKSALLRMIVVDLLAEEPTFVGSVWRLQEVLPVWLPFSFWTNLARKKGGAVSVMEAVRAWLEVYNHDDLWGLVEKALRDERALIVVDGLDEWASPDLARQCLNRLEVFAGTHNTAVLASSRPFSPAELPADRSRWRIAALAGLDADQQRAFVRRWLRPLTSPSALDGEAAALSEEIDASPHLRELADLPLFLSLLLQSRELQNEFPEDLYAVLDSAVGRLIGEHRKKKIVTAEREADFPRTGEIRKISSVMADHLHTRSLTAIDDEELADTFRRGLIDYLGYPRGEAHTTANTLIDALSPGVGLLVRPAPDQTQFFHRSAQEFLAAEHLQRLPADDQTTLIVERLTDPHWTAVLGFLIRSLVRPPEISALFDTLAQRAAADPRYSEAVDLLAADIATGAGRADAPIRRRLAERVITEVEYGERHAHRARLIDKLVAGLTRRELHEMLTARFGRWLSGSDTITWRAVLSAAAGWDDKEALLDLLWHALHTDDDHVQRAAGQLLGRSFGGRPDVVGQIAELAARTGLPRRRAAATEALSLADPHLPALNDLVASGIRHRDYAVRHASIAADLRRGHATDAHRDALIELLDTGGMVDVWGEGLIDLMIDHFPDDQMIFDHHLAHLGAVVPGRGQPTPMRHAAAVVLNGYPQRLEARAHLLSVVAAAQNEQTTGTLRAEEIPWERIGPLYREDAEVVAAVDGLIAAHIGNSIADRDLYMWSQLSRSDKARQQLLDRLAAHEGFGVGWMVKALLEGWPNDPEVRGMLTAIIQSDRLRVVSGMLPFIADIVTEPSAALDLLERLAPSLLADGRVPSALEGIVNAGADPDDPRIQRIVEMACGEPLHPKWGSHEPVLYQAFAGHQPVRELAESRLDGREFPWWAFAAGFGHDATLREVVCDRFRPLSAPLRGRLVEALTATPAAADTVTALLARYDNEPDLTVKILSVTGYARLRRQSGRSVDDLVQALTAQVTEGGPDHQEREAAALCALADLGRLDVLTDLISPFSKEPVVIQAPFLGGTALFFRYVCRYWAELTATIGPDPAERLGLRGDSSWYERFLEVAHDYPETQSHLTEALTSQPGLAASDAGLRYRWRRDGAGPELREAVITRLKGHEHPSRECWTALHFLQEHYADDPATTDWLDTVLAGLQAIPRAERRLPTFGTLAAIARLRPDHPLLPDLLQLTEATRGLPWRTFPEWAELAAATAHSANDFIAAAVRAAKIVRINGSDANLAHRAPAAHLRRNPDLATAVAGKVPELTQATLGIISRLLALAGRLDGQAVDRLRGEASGRHHSTPWTYDPLPGQVRHITLLALDLLDAIDR